MRNTETIVQSRDLFAPVPPTRRGLCPSLLKPMQTGDGLLARFRPIDNAMTLAGLGALAAAAERYGNGRIEVTARGSVQARGLPSEHVAAFAETVEAGIAVERGVPVEVPALAGLLAGELADPRPVAAALRAEIALENLTGTISPKVCIIVDGGGPLGPDGLPADIRLKAMDAQVWQLELAGQPMGQFRAAEAVSEAVVLLTHIAAKGPKARGRDIKGLGKPMIGTLAQLVGAHKLKDGAYALGLGLGAVEAAAIAELARKAEKLGAEGVRFGPRAMLVTGLSASAREKLRKVARKLGFLTEPDDPRLLIAACPGSAGCASGHVAGRMLAQRLADLAPSVCDNSHVLHVSGCAKGCAHPSVARITLVGMAEGLGLVVRGMAADAPILQVPIDRVEEGFVRLESLCRDSRYAQESASEWLDRLEPEEIAAAFA